MTSYNTNFTLDRHDVELIETALQTQKNELSKLRLAHISENATPDAAVMAQLNDMLNDVNGLMGRLHNQKVFFRPKRKPYVSG